jgi:uncharacterized protein YxeA
MKHTLLVFVLSCIAIIFLGCKGDDAVVYNEFVKATLNGDPYEASHDFEYNSYDVDFNSNGGTNDFNFYGRERRPNGDYIEIGARLEGFNGIGTYTFLDNDLRFYLKNRRSTISVITMEDETPVRLTITKNGDTYIEGTFEFTAINTANTNFTYVVTNGSFKIEKDRPF